MNPANDATAFDVAVVGFGPTGAVAAALLGQAGIKTFVCDRAREVYDRPRAIALDHEIQRVFQQIGVMEAVAPWLEPFTDSLYFGVDGQLIRRMSTVAPPYPLGYVPSVVFTQPPVEEALRARVRGLPSVEVALGCELLRLEQDGEGVDLQLRDDDGAERSVRARYVIACDGASSRVREQVGIELQDLEFDEPWLVIDVLANERGLAKLPQTSVQYCEPGRPSSFIIGPGNHRRWEISLHEGEDPKAMATPEQTWKLLARWIGPDDGELWRQASYRFHALVAKDWRRGRVFVAGDAAHQQPPFLGQGLCQGVRDVANLTWKLAAVRRGEAGDALLDSYGEERKLHVTQLTTRIKAIGAVICERDPQRARGRDARLLAEAGGSVRPTPRQDVLPRLEAGLVDTERQHPANGTIFPQPFLVEGESRVRFDERAGHGWLLVIDAGAPAVTLEAQALLDRLHIVPVRVGGADAGALREAEGVLARWFEGHVCAAALVRPDRYVYGVVARLDELPAQLARLEARLR